MRRIRLSKMVPVLAVLALVAAPVTAQNIEAGDDSWATPGGGDTFVELNSADWQAICPELQPDANNNVPQTHQIGFKGVPTSGEGDSSVVVERLDDAVFGNDDSDVVRVKMTHLAFESESTTATPCGNLDFRVGLNGEQAVAWMLIEREGDWGGHFFVDLPVDAVIEAIDPATQQVVGSVIKDGTLFEPTGGTAWSYDAPANPHDPNAPWHPGVTSTGQRQTIVRHHTFPASHAYKPVTYCGSGSVGVGVDSTSSSSIDIAQPSPCPQPIDREERHDVEDSQDVSGSGDVSSATN